MAYFWLQHAPVSIVFDFLAVCLWLRATAWYALMVQGKDIPRWMYFPDYRDFETKTMEPSVGRFVRKDIVAKVLSGLFVLVVVWANHRGYGSRYLAKGPSTEALFIAILYPLFHVLVWLIPVLLLERYVKRLDRYLDDDSKKGT